jgi:signal transduction histidine kinase
VERRSGARNVQATLTGDGESVRLTVSDDGHGVGAKQAEGSNALGLLQLRERLAVFGGTLEVEETPAEGTRLTAVLPFRDASTGRP